MTITDDEIQRLRNSATSRRDMDRVLDELERLRKENAELAQGWINERAIQDRVAATNLAKLTKVREDLKYLRAVGDRVMPKKFGSSSITSTIDRLLEELSE